MIKLVTERSNSDLIVETAGLALMSHPEIRVTIAEPDLSMEAEDFLRYVSNYVSTSGKRIRSGETMAYGYWLLKFQSRTNDVLETWEYNADATDFIRGAQLALSYWRDQHLICNRHKGEFKPPRPDKLTVISPGVLEGLPVEGVRYPSPDHMSGWWLTTGQYDGNIQHLKNQHTYHVTAARPELAKYLALPEGFRFRVSPEGDDVWFDEKVAAERP